jgi:hypothetical protein
MKCIKKGNKILRISDEEAFFKVNGSGSEWNYCPKSEWKELRKSTQVKKKVNKKNKNEYGKKEKPKKSQ